MTKPLPSILATKADFKIYFRNFHLEKNTQLGKWCKEDIHGAYMPQKESDLNLNWCSLIIKSVHLDKCTNLSELVFLYRKCGIVTTKWENEDKVPGLNKIDTQQMLVSFISLLASWKGHVQQRSHTPLATKTIRGLYRILKQLCLSTY